VYEYHWQHKLIEDLDAAVATMSEICDARELEFADRITDARAAWGVSIDNESDALDEFTDARDADCDAAQVTQTTLLSEYTESSKARFSEWADGERTALEEFIADCDEAW
jgi:hypothetical protein